MRERKLSLKRETVVELTAGDLAAVNGGTYSAPNPFCLLSYTAPCVTFLCSKASCLDTIIGDTK